MVTDFLKIWTRRTGIMYSIIWCIYIYIYVYMCVLYIYIWSYINSSCSYSSDIFTSAVMFPARLGFEQFHGEVTSAGRLRQLWTSRAVLMIGSLIFLVWSYIRQKYRIPNFYQPYAWYSMNMCFFCHSKSWYSISMYFQNVLILWITVLSFDETCIVGKSSISSHEFAIKLRKIFQPVMYEY